MADEEYSQVLTQEKLDCLELDCHLAGSMSEVDSSGTIMSACVLTASSCEMKSSCEEEMDIESGVNVNSVEDIGAPSMKAGRLNNVGYFLTWPQNDMVKEVVLEKICDMFKPKVDYAVVCNEEHKDGTPHVHAVIKFNKRNSCSFDVLDKITGKRGNYQGCRSINSCLDYIAKDGNWCEFGIDLRAHLKKVKKKQNRKSVIAMKMIKDGSDIDDMVDKLPGFTFLNKRKIDDWIDYYEMKKYKKQKLDWNKALEVLALSPLIDTPNGELICSWLFRNIRKPRSFKQKQLMIHGVPNLGKTSLVMFLEKHLKVFHMNLQNNYDDGWKNNYYDLCVIDEFKAQRKIQYLSGWLQGGTFPLNVRYVKMDKMDNVPTLILGNFDLEACYHNCNYTQIEPLYVRLDVVEITQFLEINQ